MYVSETHTSQLLSCATRYGNHCSLTNARYPERSVLQCVTVFAVCCSALQYVALCCVCCNMSLCLAVCSVLRYVAVCCSLLQYVAMCCSALQRVAMCCNIVQCVAVYCSVLQCVAMCCSVLQCVAVHDISRGTLLSYSSLIKHALLHTDEPHIHTSSHTDLSH